LDAPQFLSPSIVRVDLVRKQEKAGQTKMTLKQSRVTAGVS